MIVTLVVRMDKIRETFFFFKQDYIVSQDNNSLMSWHYIWPFAVCFMKFSSILPAADIATAWDV